MTITTNNYKHFVPRERTLPYHNRLVGKYVADIFFDEGVISITDPCYNKDVWCRLNDIKIVPGNYQVNVYTDPSEGGSFILQIVLTDESVIAAFEDKNQNINRSWRVLDENIGVDAGICGFFQNKPDFNNAEWSKFCSAINWSDDGYMWNGDSPKQKGFFCNSGYGDGIYSVHAIRRKVNGRKTPRIVALELRF